MGDCSLYNYNPAHCTYIQTFPPIKMAADEHECNVSERCLRYKNMDFPLMDYMIAYMENPYDEETNPDVNTSYVCSF